MSRFVVALETSGLLAIATLLIVALNGNYWYDIKGADLSEQGFGENLTLHGGLFRSCGPPLDPDSGKDEDCPQFEQVLGPWIQRPLNIGRGLMLSAIALCLVVLMLSLQTRQMFRYRQSVYIAILTCILAAFSFAAVFIVSTGILVCNCLDEIGPDGWMALACVGIAILLLAVPKEKTLDGEYKNAYESLYYAAVLVMIMLALCSPLFDSSQYRTKFTDDDELSSLRPTINPPAPEDRVCEKQYGMWSYCEGHCLGDEFKYWQCDAWSGYLEMQDKLNQKNWRSKIPFGMIITWLLTSLVILVHIHLVIERSRLMFGTVRSLQTAISVETALIFSLYTFSILEAHSPSAPFNASYTAESFYIMLSVLIVDFLDLAVRIIVQLQ